MRVSEQMTRGKGGQPAALSESEAGGQVLDPRGPRLAVLWSVRDSINPRRRRSSEARRVDAEGARPSCGWEGAGPTGPALSRVRRGCMFPAAPACAPRMLAPLSSAMMRPPPGPVGAPLPPLRGEGTRPALVSGRGQSGKCPAGPLSHFQPPSVRVPLLGEKIKGNGVLCDFLFQKNAGRQVNDLSRASLGHYIIPLCPPPPVSPRGPHPAPGLCPWTRCPCLHCPRVPTG